MPRASALFLLAVTLAAPSLGCSKKHESATNPDEAATAAGEVDPLVELQAIPAQIQAEVDVVLQPITDVDVVIDQVTSMPQTLGLDAASLRGLAKASLDSGQVSVNIDIAADADAKAEVEAVLVEITGIVTGLAETPARVETATGNIVALGTKATGLVTKLTAKYQAKLSNPRLGADAKAKLQGELDTVLALDAEIEATIADAKTTVTSLPDKGKDALVKLTAAFAGSASADAG